MEIPCYKCQAPIEEGVAFCPHCGAPQIRVSIPEGNAVSSPPFPPDSPGSLSPPPTESVFPASEGPYPHGPAEVDWNQAWRGALLAGTGAAVLMVIPVISTGCCLWMLGAGALSVSLYQKRVPGTVTPGMGMKLGALAGVFGFGLNAVFRAIQFSFPGAREAFREALQQQLNRSMATSPDPQTQEITRRVFEWVNTPGGTATMVVSSAIMMAFIFLFFTAAGGALGASVFGRSRRY